MAETALVVVDMLNSYLHEDAEVLAANVRHYSVSVPPDAVAHIDPELGRAALAMMQRNMSADTTGSADCLR